MITIEKIKYNLNKKNRIRKEKGMVSYSPTLSSCKGKGGYNPVKVA
jgi:hypothetical protein